MILPEGPKIKIEDIRSLMHEQAPAAKTAAAVNPLATGRREYLQIRNGFDVAVNDVTYRDGSVFSHDDGGCLKLHCKLTGECEIAHDGEEFLPVDAGRLSLLVQPSATVKRERTRVNSRERSVTMICRRDFTTRIIGGAQDELPGAMADFVRGREVRPTLLSAPLTQEMRRIVEDMLCPTYTGALREVILEAKALELLCLSLSQVRGSPFGTRTLKSKDQQKVRELCAFLDDQPFGRESISQLSRMLAWNESQMMDSFKRVTGTTIADYRLRLRMEDARRKLAETQTSITEIAFEAGYDHPNNFTTAFRRIFGVSPTEFRARR